MVLEKRRSNIQSAEKRIGQLKQIIPEAFIGDKIDWQAVKKILGGYNGDEEPVSETFGLFWPGKKAAQKNVSTPPEGILIPCPGKGINEEKTRNIFIEGENLESLKLLQKSYLGKIKMIYIDPPYNTGNEFIYNDDFAETIEEYVKRTGKPHKNSTTKTKTGGRFHSKWLSMMYPRLSLAKTFLKEDGIIFISIGEEEVANLKLICDEIFGEENFVNYVSRVAKTASDLGTFFAPSIDFILCYAKNINQLKEFYGEVDVSLYKKIEIDGERKGERYRDDVAFYQSSLKDIRPNQKYFIKCPDGEKVIPPCKVLDEVQRRGEGRWRWSKKTYMEQKHLLVFKQTKTSPLLNQNGKKAKWNIYTKSYLSDRKDKGTKPRNFLDEFINRKGADLLKKYGIEFSFSKPVGLITFLLKIIQSGDGDIILDFFAGSSTTAHAVMELNKEDGKKRQFICIQLAEATDHDIRTKQGYDNIAQLSLERIKRVSKKIDSGKGDFGVKVFKLVHSTSGNSKKQIEFSRKTL